MRIQGVYAVVFRRHKNNIVLCAGDGEVSYIKRLSEDHTVQMYRLCELSKSIDVHIGWSKSGLVEVRARACQIELVSENPINRWRRRWRGWWGRGGRGTGVDVRSRLRNPPCKHLLPPSRTKTQPTDISWTCLSVSSRSWHSANRIRAGWVVPGHGRSTISSEGTRKLSLIAHVRCEVVSSGWLRTLETVKFI